MANRSYLLDNKRERERIHALVARLTDADMIRPLGNGWTVSALLAHLAFWDRLWLDKFGEWQRTGEVRIPPAEADAMNNAMLPWWLAKGVPEVRRDVVAAAEAIDSMVESLPDPVMEQILAIRPRTAIRATHRREHLADIERAVGFGT